MASSQEQELKKTSTLHEKATRIMLAELSKNPSLSTDKLMEIFNEKVRKLTHSAMSKIYWKTYKDLILKLSEYGIIFGGCARDWYKRTYGAFIFHKYCTQHELDPDLYYNDANFLPETFKLRTTIPNDIDIRIRRSNYVKALEFINSMSSVFTVCERECATPYILNMDGVAFKSYNLYIKKLQKTSSTFIDNIIGKPMSSMYNNIFSKFIKIDFVIVEDDNTNESSKLPFCDIDFLCNYLQLTLCKVETSRNLLDISIMSKTSKQFPYEKFGIPISTNPYERNLQAYNLITKSIIDGIAIAIRPDTHRIRKIINYDWKLDFKYIEPPTITIKFDGEISDHRKDLEKCIICLEIFNNDEKVFSPCFKGRQFIRNSAVYPCKGHMHFECFHQTFTQESVLTRYNFVPRCNHCNVEYIKPSCHCYYMNVYLAYKFYLNKREKTNNGEFLSQSERIYVEYKCRCPEYIE